MVERDINFEDPVIQRKYEDAIEKLGPAGRLTRTFSLLAQMHGMLAQVISLEHPELSHRELRRQVAQRLYLSDATIQSALEKLQ